MAGRVSGRALNRKFSVPPLKVGADSWSIYIDVKLGSALGVQTHTLKDCLIRAHVQNGRPLGLNLTLAAAMHTARRPTQQRTRVSDDLPPRSVKTGLMYSLNFSLISAYAS